MKKAYNVVKNNKIVTATVVLAGGYVIATTLMPSVRDRINENLKKKDKDLENSSILAKPFKAGAVIVMVTASAIVLGADYLINQTSFWFPLM